jgi:putative hydrolase of the HAD superfamily
VFDLDDTLYPYRAFVRSGFRAVSRHLADERGLPAPGVLRVLRQALAGPECGRELQALCTRFSLGPGSLPSLVGVMREHTPTLRLPDGARRTLSALAGWRIGILTNGDPRIQRRKVAALGLERLVDHVVYASEVVEGGKPSPRAFEAVLERLHVKPARSVFVGDDLDADIAGAAGVGMKTIHVVSDRSCAASRCDAHLGGLERLSPLADRLVPLRM